MTLRFTVPGIPKPQGSKQGFVRNGRVTMVEMAGAPLKEWRKAITLTARLEAARQGWVLTDGPVTVKAEFFLPRPKQPKWPLPAVRPDLDKLARALLDGLTEANTIWVDDCQVTDLTLAKTYGLPGVAVTIDV